jgi:hypothetical protein
MLEQASGVQKRFQAVRVAHSSDIADQEFAFSTELLAHRMVGGWRLRSEEIGLDAVFDDGDFFGWDVPVLPSDGS